MKTDIWMPLYIGDYLADTSDLNAQQSGCYLHWLMHYWRNGPLMDSVDSLVRIGRLEGINATSIAQALLKRFFEQNGDGLWHQKRIDRELSDWNSKKLKAKEKAENAAKSRWKKDASSNACSNASSTPQALLEQCPSPSPSPISLNPSPKPRKKRVSGEMKHSSDPRHVGCKEAIFAYYRAKNDVDPDWNGREGKALGMLLGANPKLTADGMKRLLDHRAQSEVNHADRPGIWIETLGSFRSGPLDRFGKPKKTPTSQETPKTQYQLDTERQLAERTALRREAGL